MICSIWCILYKRYATLYSGDNHPYTSYIVASSHLPMISPFKAVTSSRINQLAMKTNMVFVILTWNIGVLNTRIHDDETQRYSNYVGVLIVSYFWHIKIFCQVGVATHHLGLWALIASNCKRLHIFGTVWWHMQLLAWLRGWSRLVPHSHARSVAGVRCG